MQIQHKKGKIEIKSNYIQQKTGVAIGVFIFFFAYKLYKTLHVQLHRQLHYRAFTPWVRGVPKKCKYTIQKVKWTQSNYTYNYLQQYQQKVCCCFFFYLCHSSKQFLSTMRQRATSQALHFHGVRFLFFSTCWQRWQILRPCVKIYSNSSKN